MSGKPENVRKPKVRSSGEKRASERERADQAERGDFKVNGSVVETPEGFKLRF